MLRQWTNTAFQERAWNLILGGEREKSEHLTHLIEGVSGEAQPCG